LHKCVLGVFVGNFFGLWLAGIAGESPKNIYGQKSTELQKQSCNGVWVCEGLTPIEECSAESPFRARWVPKSEHPARAWLYIQHDDGPLSQDNRVNHRAQALRSICGYIPMKSRRLQSYKTEAARGPGQATKTKRPSVRFL